MSPRCAAGTHTYTHTHTEPSTQPSLFSLLISKISPFCLWRRPCRIFRLRFTLLTTHTHTHPQRASRTDTHTHTLRLYYLQVFVYCQFCANALVGLKACQRQRVGKRKMRNERSHLPSLMHHCAAQFVNDPKFSA